MGPGRAMHIRWALASSLAAGILLQEATSYILPLITSDGLETLAYHSTPQRAACNRRTGVRRMGLLDSFLGGSEDPSTIVRRGMEAFKAGDIQGSIDLFDRALKMDSRLKPYLWQRGLSLYYANRFEEGATQFRDDVAVNPADTEEAIWAFLCEAQIASIGFDQARKQLLVVGRDARPYMRVAYDLFAGRAREADLAKVGETGDGPYFYAQLYLGLYAEARGDVDMAQKYITAAAQAPYGRTGDYMWHLSKVHKQLRRW